MTEKNGELTPVKKIVENIPVVQKLQGRELDVSDVITQVKKIKDLYEQVLVKDMHYGIIPGCGHKPTLLKAGAEKIAMLLQLAPQIKELKETTLANNHKDIMIIISVTKKNTGVVWGEGIGSCSTMEKKYRYVKNVYGEPVERTDIADQYNTVFKMAYKRALVSAILSCAGVSDIFTQDIEDANFQTENYHEKKVPEFNYKEKEDNQKEIAKPVSEIPKFDEEPPGTKKNISPSIPKSEEGLRSEIKLMLEIVYGNDIDKIYETIVKFSAYNSKKTGKKVSTHDINKLSGRWLEITHSKILNEFKKWEKKNYAGLDDQLKHEDDYGAR